MFEHNIAVTTGGYSSIVGTSYAFITTLHSNIGPPPYHPWSNFHVDSGIKTISLLTIKLVFNVISLTPSISELSI